MPDNLRLIEAKLFAANYASTQDILRLRSLGVKWDGITRAFYKLDPEPAQK